MGAVEQIVNDYNASQTKYKPDPQIFEDLGSLNAFLPVGTLNLENCLGVFDRVPFVTFLLNSVFISVSTVGSASWSTRWQPSRSPACTSVGRRSCSATFSPR